MGTLIPDQPLIYERADGVVYARYRDPPHNKLPRWIVGGDPEGVAKAQGSLISYAEWKEICELSETYPTMRKLLDKLIVAYYTVKDSK
jgi:hypothetical protein